MASAFFGACFGAAALPASFFEGLAGAAVFALAGLFSFASSDSGFPAFAAGFVAFSAFAGLACLVFAAAGFCAAAFFAGCFLTAAVFFTDAGFLLLLGDGDLPAGLLAVFSDPAFALLAGFLATGFFAAALAFAAPALAPALEGAFLAGDLVDFLEAVLPPAVFFTAAALRRAAGLAGFFLAPVCADFSAVFVAMISSSMRGESGGRRRIVLRRPSCASSTAVGTRWRCPNLEAQSHATLRLQGAKPRTGACRNKETSLFQRVALRPSSGG
ncbi:hypothetical protein [Amphiplicatus metriothermophilus]|uniref:hypothetical protein n=1 Tax=Amphiplicatus metriothermophilus TaxID=1519374 RepID=UPI0011782D7C|nr:hypothetical protein [Amphiplicatus metriothermophilus]MBB5518602.1 hypothetical protein [Amphiplicatus metriothermophilus]